MGAPQRRHAPRRPRATTQRRARTLASRDGPGESEPPLGRHAVTPSRACSKITAAFRYFAPEGPLTNAAELIEPLGDGRLAVFDGWNPLLYLHGYDPDKGAGIEAFMRRVANPLREVGAAVLMTDNVSKNKDARGNWAIGSERKKSAVEVQFGMTTIEPLRRGHTGKFKLTVRKDRPGFHERPSPGLFVVTSDPETGRCSWKLDAEATTDGAFRPTNLMEKVSRYLEQRVEPCSRNQVEQNVKGKTEYKRQAIDALIEEGHAVEVKDGRSRLVKSALPFREDDDR